MYRYGIICVAAFIEHTVLPTRLHVKHTLPYHICTFNRLPEEEHSVSKHVDDIKD